MNNDLEINNPEETSKIPVTPVNATPPSAEPDEITPPSPELSAPDQSNYIQNYSIIAIRPFIKKSSVSYLFIYFFLAPIIFMFTHDLEISPYYIFFSLIISLFLGIPYILIRNRMDNIKKRYAVIEWVFSSFIGSHLSLYFFGGIQFVLLIISEVLYLLFISIHSYLFGIAARRVSDAFATRNLRYLANIWFILIFIYLLGNTIYGLIVIPPREVTTKVNQAAEKIKIIPETSQIKLTNLSESLIKNDQGNAILAITGDLYIPQDGLYIFHIISCTEYLKDHGCMSGMTYSNDLQTSIDSQPFSKNSNYTELNVTAGNHKVTFADDFRYVEAIRDNWAKSGVIWEDSFNEKVAQKPLYIEIGIFQGSVKTNQSELMLKGGGLGKIYPDYSQVYTTKTYQLEDLNKIRNSSK